ncbi:unnamed protein product [Symbiodinium sp. CCMP2592]|nr:unnamed protein product [Symbiodinium sp. CCMP2592]CAE7409781.1 unnamed protein product [Symbiodinium sp. CCMP2592]CAE7483979.1 unnamed protein product [Symbiodinium sp. CCMP2592]CAE7661624.1 unnamed protein product [Symbiodinium sp. CCMP2592]
MAEQDYVIDSDVENACGETSDYWHAETHLLRKAILHARELLFHGNTEIHFQCTIEKNGALETLKLLCAQAESPAKHECLMDLHLEHSAQSREYGQLLAAGTGATGPLYAFVCLEQEGAVTGRRRGKQHLIEFFNDNLIAWINAAGTRERIRVLRVSLVCLTH